ncbi:MAG TPA: NADH-quinone oxidoreductase subunit NuoE [Clostridiales bacterium]|jgi:NADH:ubiquinone oxidoreductase subunit E|nr:NADH-quinone oxidoreductase subunit NuoE [Clostridiales bacterium]
MCSCGKENNKYFEPFETIMSGFKGEESDLIPILQKIQEAYGYLPEDIIKRLSEKTGIFVSRIMGVATFYSQFKLKPSGKHSIKICFGTACHVNGAETVAEALCDELGIELGDTTEDGEFTLESVACLGCCSLAPVITIDDEAYGRLTPTKVREVIRNYKKEAKAV